jgi:hypothetical protein
MKYIEHTGFSFAPSHLLQDWREVSKKYNYPQINLKRPASVSDRDGVLYGAGSLFKDGKMWEHESSWTDYIGDFCHLYTVRNVCNTFEHIANMMFNGSKIGRVRYMVMKPKSCLTYHSDPEDICRLHIPIITSEGAMFINDRTVDVMDQCGSVYIFNSNVKHTAINASREDRVHLVASVYGA